MTEDDSGRVFVEFVAQHQACFLGYAHRVVVRRGFTTWTAEDVCQEMIARAWAAWPTILPEHRIGWAFTAIRNIGHEQARQRGRVGRAVDDAGDGDPWDEIECGDDPPPEVVIARLTAERIREVVLEVLDTVPAQRRELFLMSWDGVPVAEIARRMHLKEGTVTSQRARLVQKIKRRLVDEALLDERTAARRGGSR